jgi:Uma2 family endonuclease
MATQTIPSIALGQEFAVCADDSSFYEIIDGQRVEVEPMGAFESVLASLLMKSIGTFAGENRLGLAVAETLFLLDLERNLQRRPDVAFVSYPRWPEPAVPRASAWDVVPDLAVEVVSPTNSAEEIDEKIVDYFAAGVRLVWVLYPNSGRVYVCKSAKHIDVLERTEELDGSDVLPGFRLPIQSLFDAVTKPE